LWYNLVRTKEKTAVDYTEAAESDKASSVAAEGFLALARVLLSAVFFSDLKTPCKAPF